MLGQRVINNILGKQRCCNMPHPIMPKTDRMSKNYGPDISLRDEICDNCGRSVYERELIFEDGKEYCRYCIND